MAFNGTGTFNRIYSWATDAANSLKISSSRMDTEDNGFAAGLSNCITRDGQSPWLANIPAGGFKITGLANGSAASDSCTYGQLTASAALCLPLTGGTLSGGLAGTTGSFSGGLTSTTGVFSGAISSGAAISAANLTSTSDVITGSNANGWARLVNGSGALYIQAGSLNSGGATKQAIIWANMYSTAPRLQLSATDVLSDANGYEFGWKDLLVNLQSGSYTLVLTDRGKLIYCTTASGGAITIPPNSSVAFPVGTRIKLVNDDPTAARTIARGAGVSLVMAGNITNQDRTLSIAGMCELVKVGTDSWYVQGSVS